MTKPAMGDNVYTFSTLRAARLTRDQRNQPPLDLSAIIDTQSEIALAGLDVGKVVDVITTRTMALTGSTGAVVALVDGDELYYWSGSGTLAPHVGLRMPLASSLSGLCIQQDKLLYCRDSATDARVNRNAIQQVGMRSAMVTPLKCNRELVGVLVVISDQVAAYGQRDVEIIEALATFMGSTLNSAFKYAEMSAATALARATEAAAAAQQDSERQRIVSLIASGGIRPVFQPIVDLVSGAVVGHEALSRFDAANNMPIDAWFAMANRVGMCFELETACLTAIGKVASRSSTLPGYVSVNVSPRTLLDYDFGALPDLAQRGGWVIELTEHSEVEDYARLSRRVEELRAQGFRIAIDDAGAGYASLRHVLKLAPEIIKLDLSITRGIDTIVRHQQLASAIINFSIETGVSLVAEGVETAGERSTLIELGVPYGQGYLFGRPAPVA